MKIFDKCSIRTVRYPNFTPYINEGRILSYVENLVR